MSELRVIQCVLYCSNGMWPTITLSSPSSILRSQTQIQISSSWRNSCISYSGNVALLSSRSVEPFDIGFGLLFQIVGLLYIYVPMPRSWSSYNSHRHTQTHSLWRQRACSVTLMRCMYTSMSHISLMFSLCMCVPWLRQPIERFAHNLDLSNCRTVRVHSDSI